MENVLIGKKINDTKNKKLYDLSYFYHVNRGKKFAKRELGDSFHDDNYKQLYIVDEGKGILKKFIYLKEKSCINGYNMNNILTKENERPITAKYTMLIETKQGDIICLWGCEKDESKNCYVGNFIKEDEENNLILFTKEKCTVPIFSVKSIKKYKYFKNFLKEAYF